MVKETKPNVVFGISPQGNIANDLNAGADVYTWCSKPGYIDYICPQIYWTYDHPTAPFETLAKKWKSLVTADHVKTVSYTHLDVYKRQQLCVARRDFLCAHSVCGNTYVQYPCTGRIPA